MAYQPVPVTFQPGALIIPMDSTYQNNGMYKAFGLIFRLLYENVINTSVNYKPIYVYWAINPNKTAFTDIDFSATTKGYNTVLASGLHQYSGGPFIIQSDDLNYAKTIITSWNANNSPFVNIHEFVNASTVNTIAKLIRPPRVSVEDKNYGIVTDYLNAAGIPDYYALSGAYAAAPVWTSDNSSIFTSANINSGAFFGNTTQLNCRQLAYDIFISPHTNEDVWTKNPNTLPNLDEFIRLGGILHSMCASIKAIENNALFLTTSGLDDPNKGKVFFINSPQATNPLLQAVPTTDPQKLPGGSTQTWQNSLTIYKPLTKILAYFIDNNIQYDFMVAGKYQGSIFNQNANGSGAIVYEGGHSYDTKIPYTSKDQNMYTKFVLNNVLLSVVKPNLALTVSPNLISADGNPKNLAFKMQNTGGSQAKNANISITLLPNMNPSNYNIVPTSVTGNLGTGYTLNWSNITLDAGGSITFNVNNYIPTSPGEYSINYNATFSDEIFATSQNPYIMSACSTLGVIPANSPFLLVQKQANGSDNTFIEPGQNVLFSYNVTNLGSQRAYNIELVDPLLFDYFTFNLANITPAPTSIDAVNKKIIFANGLGGLSIPASPGPGNTLTITVNATHKGMAVVPPDQIINTAYVNYYNYFQGDPNPQKTSPESNPATTHIVLPDISIIKTVDKTNASIGDILKYKVDITNIGNSEITQVNLTDLIPVGTSYVVGSLTATANNFNPAGVVSAQYIPTAPQRIEVTVDGILDLIGNSIENPTSITVAFDVVVNSIAQNPITNQSSVGYTYNIGGSSSGTSTKNSNTAQTNIASLQITKTSPQYIKLGENLTYTISVTNNGLVPLTNVQVVDTIPSQTSYVSSSGATFISQVGQVITLQVNSLPINTTQTITITVKVNTLPPAPYTIINSVSAIYSVNGEPKPPINSTSTSTVVDGRINVVKSTVGNVTYAKVGDTVTYKVDVTNTGNVDVTLTNLNDVIQPLGYTNADTTNIPLNTVLQPSQTTTLTFNVTILGLPPGKKLDNTATIDFNYLVGQTPTTGQNQGTRSLNVERISVSLLKSTNKSFAEPGEEITYTFTINNQSSVSISNIYLYDPLPLNTTFVTGSFSLNPTQNPTIAPGALIASIPANSQIIASFRVRVNTNLTSAVNIPDTGSMTYNYKLNPNDPDIPAGPINSNSVNTQVEIPQIQISKSQSADYVEVGDVVTYTLTVQNTGTVNAYDVEVIDILPPELQFVPGTLVVVPQQVGDIVTGTNPSYVKISIIRNNPNVATIQFNATVISRPSSGKVSNNASANFKYSLNPQDPPTLSKQNILSNTTTTNVESINVEITKTANSTYVEVGKELTYTIQINNKSTVPVDIQFTDTLPNTTQYVGGSFNLINGGSATVVNNTPSNATVIDVDITSMSPQSVVIFSYRINVLSLPLPPSEPKITNNASATPSYRLYSGGPVRQGVPVSDSVTTDVKLIKIDVTKTVNENIARVGDILHYTVLVVNNGNSIAQNVLFNDNIPSGAEFVLNSMKINGVSTSYKPDQSTNIGNIIPGQIVTVEFDVKVVSIPPPPSKPQLENIASVLFEVESGGQLQPQSAVFSNIVNTELVNINLVAVKTVDKINVKVGETLTYTVVITNNSDIAIDNVIFTDSIPNGTTLVGSQPVINVNLGTIQPKESKTVTFMVKVTSKPCPPKLANKAIVTGSYLLQTQTITILQTQNSITIESNEVSSYVDVKIFKQFSIDTTVKIPPQKPEAEDILEIISNIEIIDTYLVKIPIVTSYEGQILTGWKLIVEGIIREKVVYIADEPAQSVHAAEFEIPFSTFIMLPKDYNNCKKIKVTGILENNCYSLNQDKRTISRSITMMIQGII